MNKKNKKKSRNPTIFWTEQELGLHTTTTKVAGDKTLEWLEGPVSMTAHERKDGSRIFVLGDLHMRLPGASCQERGHNDKTTVLHIEDLFEPISQQMRKSYPSSFVDVHLEFPFAKKGTTSSEYTTPAKPNEGYLFYDTYMKLHNAKCLYRDAQMKRLCQWPNLRFHYDDVRKLTPTLLEYATVLQSADRMIRTWDDAHTEARVPLEHVALFKHALESDRLLEYQSQTISMILSQYQQWKVPTVSQLLIDSRVDKEVAAVRDPAALQAIRTWIDMMSKELVNGQGIIALMNQVVALTSETLPKELIVVDEVQRSYEIHLEVVQPPELLQRVDESLTKTIAQLEMLNNQLLDAFSILQDLYMFARIFKSTWALPIRAIVFVGEAHARKLRAGLQTAGFQTLRSVGATAGPLGRIEIDKLPPQCLSLRDMGWPWFSFSHKEPPIIATTATTNPKSNTTLNQLPSEQKFWKPDTIQVQTSTTTTTYFMPRILSTKEGISLLWIANGNSLLAKEAHLPRRDYGWRWTDDQRKGVLVEVEINYTLYKSVPVPTGLAHATILELSSFYNYVNVIPTLQAVATDKEKEALKGLAIQSLCWLTREVVASKPKHTFIALTAISENQKTQPDLVRFYERWGFKVYARNQVENTDHMVTDTANFLKICSLASKQQTGQTGGGQDEKQLVITLPQYWKGKGSDPDEEAEKIEFLFNLELVSHDGRPGYLLQLAGQPDSVIKQHLDYIKTHHPKLMVTRIDTNDSESSNQFLITQNVVRVPVLDDALGQYLGYLTPMPDKFGFAADGNYHVGVSVNYSNIHNNLQLFGYWGNESQKPIQDLQPAFKAQMDKIRSILKPYPVEGAISVRHCQVEKTLV